MALAAVMTRVVVGVALAVMTRVVAAPRASGVREVEVRVWRAAERACQQRDASWSHSGTNALPTFSFFRPR